MRKGGGRGVKPLLREAWVEVAGLLVRSESAAATGEGAWVEVAGLLVRSGSAAATGGKRGWRLRVCWSAA